MGWDGAGALCPAPFPRCEVSDYNYEVLLLFMLGAVARVFKPGTKFEVTLSGGRSGSREVHFLPIPRCPG